MSTSAHDYNHDEKGVTSHAMTPIARGVRDDDAYPNDLEDASRKQSVVASIKANYGLAERPSDDESIKVGYDSTHRKLKPRHIQLIGIGGTIGTALYVQIGHGLLNGGPGSLFLAFTIW